jgi:putative copper export protein
MARARYRPTYTPSETSRTLARRLTPLAWICLALAGLATAGAISLVTQQPGMRYEISSSFL